MYNYSLRTAYELLRAPDRQPKCYDMTDAERSAAVAKLQSTSLEYNNDTKNLSNTQNT